MHLEKWYTSSWGSMSSWLKTAGDHWSACSGQIVKNIFNLSNSAWISRHILQLVGNKWKERDYHFSILPPWRPSLSPSFCLMSIKSFLVPSSSLDNRGIRGAWARGGFNWILSSGQSGLPVDSPRRHRCPANNYSPTLLQNNRENKKKFHPPNHCQALNQNSNQYCTSCAKVFNKVLTNVVTNIQCWDLNSVSGY